MGIEVAQENVERASALLLTHQIVRILLQRLRSIRVCVPDRLALVPHSILDHLMAFLEVRDDEVAWEGW